MPKERSVRALVYEALARTLGPTATLTPDARLREDLGMDSLDAVELLIEAEDRLGVIIPDDVAAAAVTVDDLVSVLAKNA